MYKRQIAYKAILEVYKNKTRSMINLVIAGKLIETTPGHLFRLSQGAWRPASELKVGDTVITSNGTEETVESTEEIEYDEDIDVYNLNVADFHTYFVAETEVLVHNDCGGNIVETILKVNNMKEFFSTTFGKSIKGALYKTKKRYQGQSIYQITKKIDNEYLSKGDFLYLDNLHKDHLEIFNDKGKAKAVLNLNGTLNFEKTDKILSEGRTIDVS